MCPKMKQKETRVDQAILSWTCRRQHGLMFGLAQKHREVTVGVFREILQKNPDELCWLTQCFSVSKRSARFLYCQLRESRRSVAQ